MRVLIPILLLACAPDGDWSPHGDATLRVLSSEGVSRRAAHASLEVRTDEGHVLDMVLTRRDDLFSPDYAEYVWRDGEMIQTAPATWANRDHCYYWGSLVSKDDPSLAEESQVAIRTCDGDRAIAEGVLAVRGRLFAVAGTLDSLRLTERASPVRDVPVPPEPVDLDEPPKLLDGSRHFVEQFALVDLALQDRMANPAPSEQFTTPALAIHAASLPYLAASRGYGLQFAVPTLPILVGKLTVQDARDPWGPMTGTVESGHRQPTVNADQLLNQLNGWLDHAVGDVLPEHDQTPLFTGYHLRSGQLDIVGLAQVGGVCTPGQQGSLVSGVANSGFQASAAAQVGQTVAHELGHTLGMSHDSGAAGTDCDGTTDAHIMSAVYIAPSAFSSCSVQSFNTAWRQGALSCLTPLARTTGEATCGNGLVERGETCDCGPAGCTGIDPCCDETSCTYAAGATCAGQDGCCDLNTCSPAPSGTTCREAGESCDLAETCDGVHADCPVDRAEPAGTACTTAGSEAFDGACYAGHCVAWGETCDTLGTTGSYAGSLDDPSYVANVCGTEATCGEVHCMYLGNCVPLSGETHADGTSCGDGEQCLAGQCVASSSLVGADGCLDPSRDTDADGVPDCTDSCPHDNRVTSGPCSTRSTDSGDSGDTGVRDSDTDVDPPGEEGCEGCTTGGGSPALALPLLLLLRRRR